MRVIRKKKGKSNLEDESEDDADQEGGKKKKKKKKTKEEGYSADVDAAHEHINVEQLSKKEELFQIRFIVHKARKLVGAIQVPLVRIHLDTKVLRTKPKKGKNPRWNETVTFSLTKSEVELITTPIEIKVIDSAKDTQYGLIGQYKCDLSIAWVGKGKNLFYKWFALINPDEPQDGVTGYVNISIQIIPPGEAAKDLPKMRDEEVDVSDNVFFPPGIELQPGTFIVRLLNGEDVPQMDSAMFEGFKKLVQTSEDPPAELVDPYCKIEFAGTQIESSVRYCTFDPIWNEQLMIPGEFPSMAEQIVVKLYDNDDYAIDDLIATKLIRLSDISYSASDAVLGFSPTFGPAYLPFYGSTREFNDVYDKFADLNYGVKEGIAYRGRVLLEINTKMETQLEAGENPISPIPEQETDVIMANLQRHKYHLFASFCQGNMICEKENQVEFEVSIGDYGNKFSPFASPAPSTTQPCNAVYDGNEYHFMPWGRTKPTVILHSQWEDVQYRVESLNTLIWMRDFMKMKMEQYEVLLRAFAHDYELEVKFENNLQELLSALTTLPLEPPDEDTCTDLDINLHKIRMFIINNLIDEVKAMLDGRLMYMARKEKEKRLDSVMEKMEDLCFEPQLGIPDVFIWMICGTKRVAYHRIPINEIMYSKSKFGRGKHCGSTGSFFLKMPQKDQIGAHLTLSLWFGKFEHVEQTFKPPRGSEVIVYAETYENQMCLVGGWTSKLLSRPVFSDSNGKYSLPLDCFVPPEGWQFKENWFISIDRSLTFDNEAGLKEFTEEVYEGQTRLPGSVWTGNFVTTWWSDNKGDKSPDKEEIECTEGWHWVADWEVDANRAVDPNGWEYALDTSIANYSPIERGYHLSRRRRWNRRRERISDINVLKKKHVDPEGWEYSKLFTTKFHPRERKFDMVRRRRYNRKLVSKVPMPVVFKITEEEATSNRPAKVFNMAPRIITEFEERQVHKYQLRAYLYQARGILGADPTGYSDPYARVIFGNRSATTHVIDESVSPVWDCTLVLDAVEICGYPDDIASNPPFIVIEIYDEDVMSHDQLGRVVCTPTVYNSGTYNPTKLKWFPIGGTRRSKGDLLAAFELFKMGTSGVELPHLPPFVDMRYLVPTVIRPKLQLTRVEVLTWGVRRMTDYKLIPIDAPHIDIEVGGQTLQIDKIESLKKHPNFASPHAYVDVHLPINEEYLPPINLRIMDNRAFGYTPLVAVATIKEYGKYRTEYAMLDGMGQSLQAEVAMDRALLTEVLADETDILEPELDLLGVIKEMQDIEEELEQGTLVGVPEIKADSPPKGEVALDLGLEGSPVDEVVVEVESGASRSDSQASLISRTESKADIVIGNPLTGQADLSAVSYTNLGDASAENSIIDIMINIPQTAIDASQNGKIDASKSSQLSEKEIKTLEKNAKKEAKLKMKKLKKEKINQEKHRMQAEKQRQKAAKSQAKARYKEEQARKKKAMADLEDDDDDEEFIPDDPEPVVRIHPNTHLQPRPHVPAKAAGMLGMWYGSTSPGTALNSPTLGSSNESQSTNASRLSRKETRKLQQLDEEESPHPDDILVSDWWSKYYQAIGSDPRLDVIFKERDLPVIMLYEEELENDHQQFRDLMEVIKLSRPDNELDTDDEYDSEDENDHVGLFKGSFKIYPITEEMRLQAETEDPILMFSNLPNNAPVDVVVRVYVIAGIGLTPLDFGGSVDPYLWVKCGKLVIDDSKNYQTKKINPEFGKMFEMRCSLPRDSQLIIKVYDKDLIGSNDVVGSTTIDLEDRFLSWKRASCGVASSYITDKENKDVWRDLLKPIALLKRMCLLKGWQPPIFKGKGSTLRCYVNSSEYKMKFFESGKGKPAEAAVAANKSLGSDEHRLALYILHELGVVPEHIETRTLYNDDCPGIPQGKLHLWIDIFPYDRNLPPPVDIRPRKAQKFTLRIIVWNTYDVILQDENFMGEKMSDIFCKIWMEGLPKHSQETDVHFRSLTGEGNFNWRMTYDFDYLLAEQKVVAFQKTSFFSMDATEHKYAPVLHINVYDYDTFSSDDLLGWTELSLVSMPSPTKGAKECDLDIYDAPPEKRLSIFDKKKIKGCWPVYDDTLGERELTGKIELEIEILTEEEALEKPAGQARSSPNENPTLEPPDRPVTSFNFFMNPFTVFKILIWQKYKWKIYMSFLVLLCICFLGLLIYTSPGAITTALYGSIG